MRTQKDGADMTRTAMEAFMQSRTELLLDEPFWGSLALQLKAVADTTCDTVWVDGRSLGINPEFFLNLSPLERKGLIAHEVAHCMLGHPWRRDDREFESWNRATDYALNHELVRGGFTLPKGALLEAAYDGKSAEWIYARLPAPPQGGSGQGSADTQGAGQGQPSAGNDPASGPADKGQGQPASPKGSPTGEVRDAPTDTEEGEPAPTEEHWQQAVQQAGVLSQGSMPGSLARIIEQQREPRVDWKSVLRRFVQRAATSDYSWTRPNRRYMAGGLYMPALRNEEVGTLAVAVDTSGSVDAVLLAQFEAEIQAIAEDVRPREVRVLYADARICGQDTFQQNEPVKLKPNGGGGTDFRPVFREVGDWDEPPVCVVYLTDLRGTFPAEAPDVPTLWVTGARTRIVPPFGEVVAAEGLG